jgi:undecaprenyl diphosphate synthase
MDQSALQTPPQLHVAIVMDGNGRWAAGRGLPRAAGHREGALGVRRIVEAAPGCGIDMLTLFAFSADNWRRPEREVAWLMRLFREFLRTEAPRCVAAGVRLSVLGRRDRLPAGVRQGIEQAERLTAHGRALHLRIALDYSARDGIIRAAQCLTPDTPLTREAFGRLVSIVDHGGIGRAVDLLIRTGGERRLSDFLLWECAYAELYFTDTPWPDYGAIDLAEAVADFRRRERRFGGLSPAVGARTGS